MEDELLEHTRRVLTDYLMFCAREPDAPEPPLETGPANKREL